MNLKSKKERREQIFAPQWSKNGRVSRFDASQRLEPKEFAPQGLSLTPKKAFSIAEAMIVFTIVSVALASVAPMISKQVKYNEMADVQAKVLNQRIEDVKKSAWKLTPDKKSITRPDDNVGIGVSAETNPSAKLEINNTNSTLFGFLLNVPESQASDIFSIRKGSASKLWMEKNGALGFGETKNGLNSNNAMINVSADGIIEIMPPYNATYESQNGGSPAIRVYYPKDSTDEYDNYVNIKGEWVYPTNDGKTNTFLLTSWGSMYINSIAPSRRAFVIRNGAQERFFVTNTGRAWINSKDSSGEAIQVVDDTKHRFVVRNTGLPIINLKKGAQWGLIVRDDDGNNLFVVNENGSTYVKGEISNPDLDTKFAKVNEELAVSKEMIAKSQETITELKAENVELKEKLASFESQLAEIIAINNLQKIAQKK